MNRPTALIADDEEGMRQQLRSRLQEAWPALEIVAEAANGIEAVALAGQHQPDIVFLDIHMPGMNGIDAAHAMGRRAHIVFVTAYEQYAVQAFEQGAIDYLIKPIDSARLADTVQRLRTRNQAGGALDAVLQQLAQHMPPRAWLQWIKASVGNSVRLIPVDQVHFLRAEDKYTLVAWEEGEALIRKTIRELSEELDPARFVQTHRAVIVNLACVREVVRGLNETAELHLRGRPETLPVSRNYLHHFRQM